MKFMRLALLSAGLGCAVSGTALAQDLDAAVAARQAHMTLLAFNLGPLAQMAQGRIDYDAALAQTSADNLAALVAIDPMRQFPAGSDNGAVADTDALPEIWADLDDFTARYVRLREAVGTLQGNAGVDLASLQGGLRAVGGACGACHEAYRAD